MVSSDLKPGCDRSTILLQPNQSCQAQSNRLLVAFIVCFTLLIGVGFAWIGFWYILPFAGLEAVILILVMQYVSHNLQYRELLSIDSKNIVIEKGIRKPEHRWTLIRSKTLLIIEQSDPPWETIHIRLQCEGLTVAVGDFLSETDRMVLLDELRRWGLRTQRRGPQILVDF